MLCWLKNKFVLDLYELDLRPPTSHRRVHESHTHWIPFVVNPSGSSIVLGELSFARMSSRHYCLKFNALHCWNWSPHVIVAISRIKCHNLKCEDPNSGSPKIHITTNYMTNVMIWAHFPISSNHFTCSFTYIQTDYQTITRSIFNQLNPIFHIF